MGKRDMTDTVTSDMVPEMYNSWKGVKQITRQLGTETNDEGRMSMSALIHPDQRWFPMWQVHRPQTLNEIRRPPGALAGRVAHSVLRLIVDLRVVLRAGLD
jgi:hypothetical protein